MSSTATDAGGDEEIGEISGGEEPEFPADDGDQLRRLPSNEAPPLVGSEGFRGGEENRAGGGGWSNPIEDDPNIPLEDGGGESGAGDGDGDDDDSGEETDPFDEDSDESVLLDELDEEHNPYPGGCHIPCNNEYRGTCRCKCERCMFKFDPKDRRFKKLLRQNFQSSSALLKDPPQRNLRARRPYDYTQDSQMQSCTQMVPWNVGIREWTTLCPNAGRREKGQYAGMTLPCDETFCIHDLEALSERYEEEHGNPLSEEHWEVIFPPDGRTARPYVCEHHIEDNKRYFHMGEDADNLYNSHLIRFCRVHEVELRERYRGREGWSTCTCRNVDFTKWQCRSCFQAKVEKLQRHFRRRVNPRWRGEADTETTNGDFYQRDWRGVRRMLQERHPCLKGRCGRPRLRGLARNEVLDCRCCGGFIVRPLGPLRKSARLAGRAQ